MCRKPRVGLRVQVVGKDRVFGDCFSSQKLMELEKRWEFDQHGNHRGGVRMVSSTCSRNSSNEYDELTLTGESIPGPILSLEGGDFRNSSSRIH